MTGSIPAFPSKDPANVDNLTGAIQLILTKFLQNIDNMLPARVLGYDAAKNVAQVQPLIQVVTTLNEAVSRAQVAEIPVLQLGAGGFVLRFPVAAGNLGWIHANDRDISIFRQTFAESSPNTLRKHSFSDALLIPDTMLHGVTIAAEDVSNAVFQNAAGTVKIALWSEQIKVLTPNMAITNTSAYTPNEHAILDLDSTTRAFLLPRMTTTQKNAIAAPVPGMQVFDTSLDGVSTYTSGGGWV